MTAPPPLPPARRAVSGWRVAFDLCVAVSLGFFVFVFPHIVGSSPSSEIGMGALVLYLALCVVLGVASRANWLLVGLVTVVTLPPFAIVEMAGDPTSHNLWPIEFFLYGVYGSVGALAVGTGRLLRRRFSRRSASPSA